MEGHVASSNSVVQHSAIGPCTPMPASQNRALTPRPLSLLEKCILPSVFYRGTRQSNILPSAALGKIKHSAKVALPSASHSVKPGSRQNWALPSAAIPLGKRWPARDGGHLPSDFAECLTASTRQFFFIFKNLFCRVPAPDTRQIFFYFLKTYFAECQPMALGIFLKNILPSARDRHSTICFIF